MVSTIKELLHIPASADAEQIARICSEYYALYQNVSRTARDPQVKMLAQKRMEELEKKAGEEAIPLQVPVVAHRPDFAFCPGTIESVLAGTVGLLSQEDERTVATQLSEMPDCAEKHYLQGTYLLHTAPFGRDLFEKVAGSIGNAVKGDPENFAYAAVANALAIAAGEYNEALAKWQDEENERIKKKREDEIKHIRRAKAWQITKSVFGVIGAVLAAIVTGIGALLGCVCECLDGC